MSHTERMPAKSWTEAVIDMPRRNHKWSEEEKRFLAETAPLCSSSAEAADVFNARFGLCLSAEAVRAHAWKQLHLRFSRAKRRSFDAEEKAYLTQNARKKTFRELCDGLKDISGRESSVPAVAKYVNETLGIKRGQPKKMRVGMETVRKDGYTYVKVRDDLFGGKNWRTKQAIVYEELHHVKIPDSGHVCFLDGNKSNFSAENLYLITNKIHMIMVKNRWYTESREHTLAAIKLCELIYAIKGTKETEDSE